MNHPALRPLEKAFASINAHRVAGDLDEAEDAWLDFLHHWVRAINKYDAHGKNEVGAGWVSLKKTLRSDARLTFLWEARNSDEHSIAPVAGRTAAIALVNPLAIVVGDGLVVGFGGEAGIDLGEGISVTFSPGSLHLVSVCGRGEMYDPPIDDGWVMTPLALMEYGARVLRNVLSS